MPSFRCRRKACCWPVPPLKAISTSGQEIAQLIDTAVSPQNGLEMKPVIQFFDVFSRPVHRSTSGSFKFK